MSWPSPSAAGAAGVVTTSAAYEALKDASSLVPGTTYFIPELPAMWFASTDDAAGVVGMPFEHNGSNYVGDELVGTTTEVDLTAGSFATRPTSDPGASGTVSYRRMTDVGTLPGGRVMSWLNGTSTEWRAADRDAPHHGRITTAAMLAISSPGTGATCELTDCGNIVSTWYYNGTYWVPFGGEQKIYSLMADTYNATADGTERVNGNAQCTIPANLLSTDGMGFKLRFAAYKSAAAESPVVAIKFGANGTIADTVMAGSWTMATTNRQLAQELSAKRASSSTLQAQGAGAVTATGHRFGNQTSGARVTALSGLSFAAATYLSMTVQRTTPFAEYMVTDVFDVWLTGR